MPIITLTSDWGLRDYYLAAVKGTILKHLPAAQIIDISHQIAHHDIIQASIIFKNSFHHFPEGTIHIIGVSSQKEADAVHLAVKYQGHYFIGADNGIFSLVMDKDPQQIVEIGMDVKGTTFPARDIFVKAACDIASGKPLASLGPARTSFWERVLLRPAVESNLIRGNVLYVDSFENVVTNISRELFEATGKGKAFNLILKKSQYDITEISSNYGNMEVGKIIALFNSQNLLEISIFKGKAAGLLGLHFNDTILIEFED